MTEGTTGQTDAANLAATGNTQTAGTAGVAGAAPAKTLDTTKGQLSGSNPQHKPKTLDQIAAEQHERDVAKGTIDPKTGDLATNKPAVDQTIHANPAQKPADAHAEAARANNVTKNEVDPVKTAEIQDKVMAARSDGNAAGQAVLNEKAEKDAEKAHNSKPKNPNIGKERNTTTPVIDAQGNKTWPA